MTLRDNLERLASPRLQVACLYSRSAPPPAPEHNGVRYYHRAGASPQDLARAALDLAPDVLIVHDRGCWEACSQLPLRKLATVHYWTGVLADPRAAHLPDHRRPAGNIVEILGRYDGVIANSSFCRDLLASIGVAPERIVVVNPRPRLLDRAVSCAVERRGEQRGVLVVGKLKMRPDVLDALDSGGLRVIPYDEPGFATLSPGQMAEAFAAAEVLAHPTFLSEAYCKTVVEAMAYGLPVVYANLGHVPRLVGRSAGIPLDHGATPASWVKAVRRAKARQEAMGRVAQRRAGWIARYADTPADLLSALSRGARGDASGIPSATILVPSYPGCWTAAQHLAGVHGCRIIGDPAQGWGNLLILGSYRSDWLQQVPRWTAGGTRVCIWWHSDLAQSDFSAELQWLKRVSEMVRSGELYAILPTSETLTRALTASGVRAFWLPDVLAPTSIGSGVSRAPGRHPIVGLFSSPSIRKNLATSLGAAALASAEVWAFPSLLKQPRLAALTDVLRLRVTTHDPPYDRKQPLYDLLARCTATVHPTHGDTFNYAAAESVQLGVPAIASGCIPCLQLVEHDDGLTRLADDSDCIEISRRIRLLHEQPELRAKVAEAQRRGLEEVAFRNELISRRTLVEVLP